MISNKEMGKRLIDEDGNLEVLISELVPVINETCSRSHILRKT